VNVAVPGTVNALLCVIAPPESTVKSPPNVDDPRSIALLSLTCTAPVPEFKAIAPVKVLVWVRVMALDPETVKTESPVTANAPVCVIDPFEVITVKLPPNVDAARIVAELSVTCTAPVPELKVIAAVKVLVWHD